MTLEERGPADMVVALALVSSRIDWQQRAADGVRGLPGPARAARHRRIRAEGRSDGATNADSARRRLRRLHRRALRAGVSPLRFVLDERVALAGSNRVIYLMTVKRASPDGASRSRRGWVSRSLVWFFYPLASALEGDPSITCSGSRGTRRGSRGGPRGADRALCDRHPWHTEDVGARGGRRALADQQSLGVIRPRGRSANFRCAAS